MSTLELRSPEDAAHWLQSRVTGTLRSDSRAVQPGDGFLAWPGAATDARRYVADALASGAAAVLIEGHDAATFAFDTADVEDSRLAVYGGSAGLKADSGPIASRYFKHNSLALAVIAITGTNGKTSSAWWLAQALSTLELAPPVPSAVIGTLGVGTPPDKVQGCGGLTTPDPVTLHAVLRRFADDGLRVCAIEASSIGLAEHRLDATRIHTAVLTNFTQDHLDYHGSMAAYWQAKARLFGWPGLQAAVINVDDPTGQALAADLQTRPQHSSLDVWTVSMHIPARLRAMDLEHSPHGMRFAVVEGALRKVLTTGLFGSYNVSNLLGVIAAMRTLGIPLAAAVQACSRLSPVPGRMECVNQAGQPLVAVDYAHTPDALAKALDALRPLAQQRGGQLWCVFGCGGDRDSGKRPLMGVIAGSHADHVVVTSDNPRSEAIDTLISQILLGLTGVPHVTVEPDRARAIEQTLARAAAADVVLIAGKGHEDYQEIKGLRLPFCDLVQVQRALAMRPAPCVTRRHPPTRHTPMTLQEAVSSLPQAQPVGITATQTLGIARVYTDSRSMATGDLFVALPGERFNANNFLQQAHTGGAVAALCQGDEAAAQMAQAGLPGWVVPDTHQALIELATLWRAQFALVLIAVTGSNGKTTVTQMMASILRASMADAALATLGNLNNAIGVPLTLLRLTDLHRMAVVELGMNHPGEVALLSAIARPTVALVNNAQREHLEFMHSVSAVAQENGSVIDALPEDGVAVFPADDPFNPLWSQMAGARRVIRFAAAPQADADVYPQTVTWTGTAWQVVATTPVGDLRYDLAIAGLHNVKNSLAAVACALAADIPLAAIATGLGAFEPVKGRSRSLSVTCQGRPLTLIDDSYNANPDSVRAAIDVLATLPVPRLLVLGDMGEVGGYSHEFHTEALRHALAQRSTQVLVIGAAFAQAAVQLDAVRAFADMVDLQAAVLAALPGVASILVKGSRFMQMERVVKAIMTVTKNGSIVC